MQVPDCNYEPVYSYSLKGDISGGYNGTNKLWPDYITFTNSTDDRFTSMNYKVNSDNITMDGEFIEIDFIIDYVNKIDPSNIYVDTSIRLPWKLSFVYFPYNYEPYYNVTLEN